MNEQTVEEVGKVLSPVDKRRNSAQFLSTVLDPYSTGRPHPNVAELLTQEELNRIGVTVVREFEVDKSSRTEWDEITQEAMKIAKQTVEAKTDPWPGAANIKYPLISNASIMFASRAYPALVNGREVVHCTVIGKDETGDKASRATRVAEHMSWQVLEELECWEEELDKLLHVLPVVGMCFRKTYFCQNEKQIRSDLVLTDDLVIHYRAKSLERARRITQIIEHHQNDIYEMVASGLWLDAHLPMASNDSDGNDDDPAHEFLEQHRWLDLDGDGYQEPWIVTVHKETCRVVRIVARFEEQGVEDDENGKVIRIKPVDYFTKYGFFPNPDGSLYDLGFGQLLYPINSAINSILNQLIDAGSLANLQSGWIDKSIRESTGPLRFKLGEWKKTDAKTNNLRDKIFPMPTKEPSPSLFQLLNIMIEAGKDLGNVKEVLEGKSLGANTPATTVLALIEQGLQQFSAVYKRLYRSQGKEYKKIFKLNSVYLDPEVYFRVMDDPAEKRVLLSDYDVENLDVVPAADPNMVSDVQRMARAQAIEQTLGQREGVNQDEITQRYLEALNIPDRQKLIIPPEERQEPPEDPMITIKREEVAIMRDKFEFQVVQAIQAQEMDARKIAEIEAKTAKLLAQAEAEELGPQLQLYLAEVQGMYQTAIERLKQAGNNAKQGAGNAANTGGNQPMEGGASIPTPPGTLVQ